MNERRVVKEAISSYLELEGSIDGVIEYLLELKKTNEDKGFFDIEIDMEYGHYDGDSDRFYLKGSRFETDEEFEKRLQKEEKEKEKKRIRKEKTKELEIKKLKSLLKKYGKDIE